MLGSTPIAQRILRDGALRGLPVWLGIVLLSSNLMAVTAVYRAARLGTPAPPHTLLVLTLWLPLAAFLLLGRSRARSHRLELALPIPARELWLSRCLAMACAAAVMLAATFGILTLVGLLLHSFYEGPDPAVLLPPLIAPISAAAVLGIVFVQGAQPGAWRPSRLGAGWAWLVVGLVLVPLLLQALEAWPLAATGLFLVLAGLLAWRTWTALPAALELTPLVERARADGATGRAAGATPARAVDADSPPGAIAIAGRLFAMLNNAPPWRQAMPWLLYFFIALVAFFLAGGFGRWIGLDESRLLNLPLGAYMLFTGAGILTYHLHRLDPLPLSRDFIFAILVLPSLLFFGLGWGAGRLAMVATGERQLVDYRIAGEQQWVQIDPGFLAVTTDGQAPRLESPWGESHPAWQRRLVRGGGLLVYSPYDTPAASSARFEALMVSRAVERVYGAAIPAAEILGRYFEVEDDRIVGLEGPGLTLSADYPSLSPPPRGAETPVYLTLTLVPWLLLLTGFLRSLRATVSVGRIRGIYWIGLGVLLAALIGQVVLTITRVYSADAAYGLLTMLCFRLSASPLATAIAWIVCLTLVALTYRLALARFRLAELPVSPLQCSLVDWGKGG